MAAIANEFVRMVFTSSIESGMGNVFYHPEPPPRPFFSSGKPATQELLTPAPLRDINGEAP